MTDQEFFDATLNHLRTQRTRSVVCCTDDGSWQCVYRDDEGRKCAIGFWIPDEDYDPQLEGFTFECLNGDPRPELPLLETIMKKRGITNWGLCRSLQMLHDHETNWDDEPLPGFNSRGETAARMVANQYGLSYTPPS